MFKLWLCVILLWYLPLLECTDPKVNYKIQYTGYKYIEIIVNAKYFGQSEEWKQMDTLAVPAVPKIIALVGEKRGGDGGLMVQIDSKPPVVTDGTWKCTKAEFAPDNWYEEKFDDSSWPSATEVGTYTSKKWAANEKFPTISHNAKWIWNNNATSEIYCRSPKLHLDAHKVNHAAEFQNFGGPPQWNWRGNGWGRGRGRGRGRWGRNRWARPSRSRWQRQRWARNRRLQQQRRRRMQMMRARRERMMRAKRERMMREKRERMMRARRKHQGPRGPAVQPKGPSRQGGPAGPGRQGGPAGPGNQGGPAGPWGQPRQERRQRVWNIWGNRGWGRRRHRGRFRQWNFRRWF